MAGRSGPGGTSRDLWLPTKYGAACSLDFVQAFYPCGMWGMVKQVWITLGFSSDLFHRVDEEIEFFLSFFFGGLYHQGALNNERECHGWRMKSIIHQPLGNVHNGDVLRRLLFV